MKNEKRVVVFAVMVMFIVLCLIFPEIYGAGNVSNDNWAEYKVDWINNNGGHISTDNNISYEVDSADEDEDEIYVWVAKSGKRYHRYEDCSNMKNPQQMTMSQAKKRGKTPCHVCYY